MLGTRNAARACARRGMRLIHVSTDFVFDGEQEEALSEASAPRPIEWYGQTKLWAEEEARAAPDCIIVRIAFPYAPPPAPKADLAQKIAANLRQGKPCHLFADQIITPTFAPDIAQGLLLLARAGEAGELFHLAGADSLSPLQFGRETARAFGLDEGLILPSSLADYLKTDPRPRQRCLRLSNAKWAAFAASHGLAAPLGAREGLRRIAEKQ
ncbi:MAG: dTDP-4-dehydrorhamnose reductase [candidate division BRC1 bacterium ADurb.BinA364]|nr:MAG: dTDP-4-dehydrorhamnose reductase [candidate division BRC1 bacterium ADurb.BinA364]